jgi:hypothetical protein
VITDINMRSNIGPGLRQENLEPYWAQYFAFRDDTPALHATAERELRLEVENARGQARPFVDSQQAISRVLTKLGPTATFHRQFREQHPDSHPNQVLGMQLYALIAADNDTWVFTPIHHAGHMFPHASYFLPGR